LCANTTIITFYGKGLILFISPTITPPANSRSADKRIKQARKFLGRGNSRGQSREENLCFKVGQSTQGCGVAMALLTAVVPSLALSPDDHGRKPKHLPDANHCILAGSVSQ
jgi:hypothetical protein